MQVKLLRRLTGIYARGDTTRRLDGSQFPISRSAEPFFWPNVSRFSASRRRDDCYDDYRKHTKTYKQGYGRIHT